MVPRKFLLNLLAVQHMLLQRHKFVLPPDRHNLEATGIAVVKHKEHMMRRGMLVGLALKLADPRRMRREARRDAWLFYHARLRLTTFRTALLFRHVPCLKRPQAIW